MKTFINLLSAVVFLVNPVFANAAETTAHARLTFAFGNDASVAPLHFSAGFSQLDLVGKETPPVYIPLLQITRTRAGELSPSLLGKTMNASEGGNGPSWLWWGVGAVAAVVVIAVVSGSSGDKEKPVTEGSATSVCGNDSVLIGNECVAVPRRM